MTLYANVVAATHGESRQEVLGSGDAALAFQQMKLTKSPLTYVSAPVPSGGVSTLELRVNDILWKEASNPLELLAERPPVHPPPRRRRQHLRAVR